MKKTFKKTALLIAVISFLSSCNLAAGDFKDISSVKMAEDMSIGWNLGNAFDASSCDSWAYTEGLGMEYAWLPEGKKIATKRNLIKEVKKAGFKTIRIPVSWHNHMNKTTYAIDSAWMNRVQELVDWALAEDMYVIINIHHDNLTEAEIANNPGFCLSTNSDIQQKSKNYITTVWAQISETFKDYDERLVFEILNEPRCIGADFEWNFSNPSDSKSWNKIITSYEQAALNVIRKSGRNNGNRFVMVPEYVASPSFLAYYTFPKDSAKDKLLLSTHAYTPYDFCLDGDKDNYDQNKIYIESSIDYLFNTLKTNYVDKGIGVVMGEASASDKGNLASRKKWAKYYFTKAKAAGIPVVLWDNERAVAFGDAAGGENHGYFDRDECTQTWPELITEMMKANKGN